MKPKVVVGIIVAALLLIFLLQNTQVVSMQFLFWKVSMSRIILLPLVMLIGFIIGFLVGRNYEEW